MHNVMIRRDGEFIYTKGHGIKISDIVDSKPTVIDKPDSEAGIMIIGLPAIIIYTDTDKFELDYPSEDERNADYAILMKIISTPSNITITNNGSNNQINASTGSRNNQSNTLYITTDNIKELRKYFSQNGIAETDLNDLQAILETDEPNRDEKQFGIGVKTWFQKMFSKSLDTTWQVGIEAAGAILSEGLKRYYGW